MGERKMTKRQTTTYKTNKIKEQATRTLLKQGVDSDAPEW
jgi:hypothetical protein